MQNKKNLFIDAMSQSLVQSMQKDKNVIILGEGVTDVKGIFNTTNLALKKFGPKRVVETPVSENALTGIQLGMSLLGKKPILKDALTEKPPLFARIPNGAPNRTNMIQAIGIENFLCASTKYLLRPFS